MPLSSQNACDVMDNARALSADVQVTYVSSKGTWFVHKVQVKSFLLGHSPLATPSTEAYGRAMESAAVPDPQAVVATSGSGGDDKGLKKNAIGFVSSVVIGVASTAPGYSLAATLGFVAAVVGTKAPAILLISFIPMFLVAAGYYYMNKADPDCGTSFSWVTKAMGPQLGWIAGWAIVVADVIVMANLAQIAGLYTFELFSWHAAAESTAAVTAVGVIWIVIMTAIVVIGIELSARTQIGLLGAEIFTLALFAVVALVKVYAGSAGPNAV